jgi:hypothetical protein
LPVLPKQTALLLSINPDFDFGAIGPLTRSEHRGVARLS